MSEPAAEFVTIAEAARRLGISERRAYRWVERLADSDRQRTESGPQRVRLSALRALARGDSQPTVADSRDDKSDSQPTVTSADDRDAMIAELRGDIAYLRETLKNQQVLTLEALRAANRKDERIQELETRLLLALPAPAETRADADSRGDSRSTVSDSQMTDADPYDNTARERTPDSQTEAHEGTQHAHTAEGRQFINDSGQDGDAVESPPMAQNRPESARTTEEVYPQAVPWENGHDTETVEEPQTFLSRPAETEAKDFQGFSPVRDGEREDRVATPRPWWRFWGR